MTRRLLAAALLSLASVLALPLLAEEVRAAHAVQSTLSGDLTLDRAVQIALRQNAEILKAFQEIERTRGLVIEVRAAALPHLTMTGNYSQQDRALLESGGSSFGNSNNSSQGQSGNSQSSQNSSNQTDQNATQDQSQNQQEGRKSSVSSSTVSGQSGSGFSVNDKSWQVTFQVRQALYTGGQVGAALKIAKFTEDSSYWKLRDTVDMVISKTRQQFVLALLNRALITVQEESVNLLTNQFKDQQNRFDAGTVPRFNVLQAEVELANARPDLIKAKNNYLLALLQLAKTLAVDASTGLKPAFKPVGELGMPPRNFGLTNAIDLAKARRPFLKVQRQMILIETQQIKVALAGYKPRLDANAGYELRNSRLSDDLSEVVNGWFFGVTGSWNIFDGGETYGRTKQAHARLESARINYQDSVQQVEIEVEQAYLDLTRARLTVLSLQKSVEQALEAVRLSQERFSAGAGTQLDVLNASVSLTRARTTELQGRADYNTALAEFDRVTATDTRYDDAFRDPLAVKVKTEEAKQGKRPPGFQTKARLRDE